ncbi:CTR9 homolog [Olea europaea subsp. europaea]|uniref:CTR9 homolog n=1 Tax=Olea europaea subsp. europaea TaxID=158383 RepID=A0A8S0UT74_OLEEU|nr:CTR9 homolog [Olea europaea subsp. europaea]
MACLYIPVKSSEEVVQVALDQLPLDATDIIDILKAEQAPLNLWLTIAREYFKQGKLEQFLQILKDGSSPEVDENFADVRYERIAILNALGAYYSYLGKIETKQGEKEEHFITASHYYNKASKIDTREPSTWIGKGQLLLAKGDIDQAFNAFNIVLDGDGNNVPALLGLACVYFSRGQYSDSLELHKLDPENVEALVALGISDLQTNEANGIRSGMEKMQRAFEIYPYCAMSLNYLANHFFFTGQHFLVEQLTETALSATTHGPTKSHSFYNLARSYHSKGDYEKAGMYYLASVQEINKPHEYVLPYYGLGQIQMKMGDLINASSNFQKVLEVQPENYETLKALGNIYVQLEQKERAQQLLKKATKVNPQDPEAFLDLGELLISTDECAALDAFETAHNLLKMGNEEVPIELLNNIGVLHFERGEFELAREMFMEALGDGMWSNFVDVKTQSSFKIEVQSNLFNRAQYPTGVSSSLRQHMELRLFHRLEEQGTSVELPWDKVSSLFNLARVLEKMHDSEAASILYHLILFKYPDYTDAYLRLAAIARAQNNIQLSLKLIGDALKVDEKCPDALLMLGDLKLKSDYWVRAKDIFLTAKEANDLRDSYATVCLGNWNFEAAYRNEKKDSKFETMHHQKAKGLYTEVLLQHSDNLYAANGAGMVFAERGHFDVAKDLFTQVQEAASGSSNVQMPDIWINLAHVHFAQGNFALAVKLYQNCLQRFYYNTESELLLYIARTHYEAEQWKDCKMSLLRAIHLSPSNYTFRFNVGVAVQKFSSSTLQKTKKSVDEVQATITELKNAVRLFSFLTAGSDLRCHGFNKKKIRTHVRYSQHLLHVAKVHCEVAEHVEQQNQERIKVWRQMELADESLRKAEEQRKLQLEKKKQEDELKQIMQQEEHLERIKEKWKSNASTSKRKNKSHTEDESGQGEKKRRKGGKRKKEKKTRYESEEADAAVGTQKEMEHEDATCKYQMNDIEDQVKNNPQDFLAASGLEDTDAEDNAPAPSSSAKGRRRALSESDEEEPMNVGGGVEDEK